MTKFLGVLLGMLEGFDNFFLIGQKHALRDNVVGYFWAVEGMRDACSAKAQSRFFVTFDRILETVNVG